MNLFLIWFLFFLNAISTNVYSFGYSNYGQVQWRKDYHGCAGTLQSPIIINSSDAVPIGMPALETIRYNDLLPEEIHLKNNGHSIALRITKTGEDHDFDSEIPYIFGGLLDNEYEFEGLHFHWGGRNNRGSEHILDDIRYPMEMHLIHRNRKYKSVKHALKHKDGLTVLGIFFQLRGKKNEHIENIIQYFPHIRKFNESVILNSSFMLSSFMPADTNIFYTYKGSLTTPPCSEVVTWIVFPDTIPISLAQINEFRKISDESGKSPMVDNYRHIQPIGKRNIFVREPMMKHSKYFSTANFLKWNWFNIKTTSNPSNML